MLDGCEVSFYHSVTTYVSYRSGFIDPATLRKVLVSHQVPLPIDMLRVVLARYVQTCFLPVCS